MESLNQRDTMPRRQLLLLGAIFAVVVGLLGLGYFLFLRTDYVVLAQGLRPGDAATVVAELDKRGAPYRLSDGGTTILVPEGQADATRVAIAGSDVAAHGQIGFELFNKSDMGLTNFAQKINYQRALQGELVRTITMMEGVEDARVHLALPERALFRGDRAEPKAAVTITMKPGLTADPSRVAGIQRLVASAVPDLPETKVVVLDASGRVISPEVALAAVEQPADLEERSAIEGYYRARARGAVERQLPGVKFALRVLVLPLGSDAATPPAVDQADPGATSAAAWVPSGDGSSRNFRVRVLFVTETALAIEDQGVVREAIVKATAFNADMGDSLSFETGPVDMPVSAPPIATSRPSAVAQNAPETPILAPTLQWSSGWIWGVVALILSLVLVWWLRRSGAARLDDEDHDAFAAKLRRQLNLEDSADAAA